MEADDIIATLAKKYAKEDFEVLIISSDKDLMQLVSPHIKMYDAMKNKMIGAFEVKEKFAVLPERVLDVLSLMGDASDNIPGVKGIGPKTAAELIDRFGNLENIFEHLDEIKQEKRRQLLQEGVEKAKLSKILLTLKEDVEMGITLEDLEVKAIDGHKLASFLEKQGFRSLVERVKKEFSINKVNLESSIESTHSTSNPSALRSADFSAVNNNSQQNNFSITNDIAQQNLFSNASNVSNTSQVVENFDNIKKTIINSVEVFARIKKQAQENGVITIDYEAKNDEVTTLTLSSTKHDEVVEEIFYSEIKTATKNATVDLFNFVEKSHESDGYNLSLQDLAEILADNSIKKIFFDTKNFMRAFSSHSRKTLI